MSYTLIAVLIVPLALALLSWQLNASAERGRVVSANNETLFRVAPWVYAVIVTVAIMCSTFLWWSFDTTRPESAIETMRVIGVVGLAGTAGAVWWYSKCAVRLNDETITISAPSGRKTVRFDCLKEVRISSGLIILDEGRIPRVIIPVIYQKTAVLLANIEYRRKRISEPHEPTQAR